MSFFLPIVNAVLGVVGLIAIVVAVIIAPWQIKLLILAVGMLFTQRALNQVRSLPDPKEAFKRSVSSSFSDQVQPSHSHPALPDQEPDHPILVSLEDSHPKLSYRGNGYEQCFRDVKICEGSVGGKYRGSIWRVHTLDAKPIQASELVPSCKTFNPDHYQQATSELDSTSSEASPGAISALLLKLSHPKQVVQQVRQKVHI